MPIDLTKPLAWKSATEDEQRMLSALQGNILKGHGRKSTLNIFFTVDPAKAHKMRAALRELANYHVTSAYQQLLDTEHFNQTGTSAGPFVAVFLSAAGYGALGVPTGQIPPDASFLGGMRNAALQDPPVAQWESAFQGLIHGLVLIADEDGNAQDLKRDKVVALLHEGGGTVVKEQAGKQMVSAAGEGIEHFGYVDGRSQPLPLVEDLTAEAQGTGIARWDPHAPIGVGLVPDPGSLDGIGFGSYFVFRKLEQNVRGFKRQEQVLADTLTLTGEARELAGALVVGRFEDGTPVTLSDEARGLKPPNDFNYTNDPGARCPFQGHIRKTNPRGSGGFETPDKERLHLMLRRGITYEDVPRAVHPSNVPGSSSAADFDANVASQLPAKDVGLLFMAYNNKLAVQFEFTQQTWANNPTFPQAPVNPGVDPVMGQQTAGAPAPHQWPKVWDDATKGTAPLPFQGFVTMKGGEYFFAPSLNALKAF